MAVLVEGISAVVRVEAIRDRYPGGWPAFQAGASNGTLCSDDELARVGFMVPDDVEAFIKSLELASLRFLTAGSARDCVVVDQIRGPTVPCQWIEFGRVPVDGGQVAACRLAGSESNLLMTPDGWVYAGSLSQTFGFVPSGAEAKSLTFLRYKEGLDVYLNRATGKEVFVARSFRSRPRRPTPKDRASGDSES
jgi:hypothetical protein